MKLLNNILYIEFPEMVSAGVSESTLKMAKYSNSNSWGFLKDPDDKRKVLIQYDSLKDKYRDLLIKYFKGDPFDYYQNQILKNYLKNDIKALDFFMTHTTPDGNPLSVEHQKEYVTCANWLNLLIDLDTCWSRYKKELGMTGKPELYDAAIKIFEVEVIKLPKAYQPLRRKIKEYQEQGYETLVSKKIGNLNSAKVKNEENSAALLYMVSHYAQYDDKYVAMQYNKLAKQRGYKTISAPTVGNYRRKNSAILDGFRKGNAAWYNKSGKIIHQDRPSAPLLLINSDDNDLDLYYQEIRIDKKGHQNTYYYYRPVLYVVMDSFNDYILGYAIGDQATTELVHEAYRNAAQHVYELTGSTYLWHQIKTDHWNLKVLGDYFEQQATFTPAAAKNARGKIIEQAFGHVWHHKLKELYPVNYKGHNINAKFKVNTDALEANKKFFPVKEKAPGDIAAFIESLRHLRNEESADKRTRQQVWLEAFDNMQDSKRRLISKEQSLMLFGKEHKHPKTGVLLSNTITNAGLEVTINGQKVIYETPKESYLDTLGLTVSVKYNPYDLNEILAVSNDGRTRFVCSKYQKMPMAIADYQPGTRAMLNERLEEKRGHVQFIVNARDERLNVLKRAQLDAESLLSAGVLTKELKYAAERQLIQGNDDDDDGDFDLHSLM